MPYSTRDLSGSVVAITGGTAGIGAATAHLLVEQGARVALAGRRPERLGELVEQLGADRAVGVATDVASAAGCRRFVDEAVKRFGRLDSVVANAGSGVYGSILDYSDDELAAMMNTNFAGTVWTVRAAVAAMATNDPPGGDVVVVSSVAGLRGGPDEAVYAGTKFAQVGLAGSLDRELRPKGIRVTAICPAGVDSEFALGTGRTPGDPSLASYMRPEDVAHAIVTVLQQPRTVRTSLWALWSMQQDS